ncbi:MAG: hypothetical protein Phyf2KO_26160 [Phycisphaerales bacterium]
MHIIADAEIRPLPIDFMSAITERSFYKQRTTPRVGVHTDRADDEILLHSISAKCRVSRH